MGNVFMQGGVFYKGVQQCSVGSRPADADSVLLL
jgi:hypothetical protein